MIALRVVGEMSSLRFGPGAISWRTRPSESSTRKPMWGVTTRPPFAIVL